MLRAASRRHVASAGLWRELLKSGGRGGTAVALLRLGSLLRRWVAAGRSLSGQICDRRGFCQSTPAKKELHLWSGLVVGEGGWRRARFPQSQSSVAGERPTPRVAAAASCPFVSANPHSCLRERSLSQRQVFAKFEPRPFPGSPFPASSPAFGLRLALKGLPPSQLSQISPSEISLIGNTITLTDYCCLREVFYSGWAPCIQLKPPVVAVFRRHADGNYQGALFSNKSPLSPLATRHCLA